MTQVDRARLPEDKFPYRGGRGGRGGEAMKNLKRGPAEIIVFYVGGATYAEARVGLCLSLHRNPDILSLHPNPRHSTPEPLHPKPET